MNCAACKSPLEPRGSYPFQRCYPCREHLPPGQSIGDNGDSFLPYIYQGDKKASLLWMHGQGRVPWRCPAGHSWLTSPRSILQGRRCIHCYGRKQPAPGNSLLEKNPALSREWCHENLLCPGEISFATGLRGCWNCSRCAHHWIATVKARSSGTRTGCPSCNSLSFTSRGENELYQALRELYPDTRQGVRDLIPHREIDIFIPSLSMALEYNGEYWHSEEMIRSRHGVSAREYHGEKVALCREVGITLLHIWESAWLERRDSTWSMILSALRGRTPHPDLFRLEAGNL